MQKQKQTKKQISSHFYVKYGSVCWNFKWLADAFWWMYWVRVWHVWLMEDYPKILAIWFSKFKKSTNLANSNFFFKINEKSCVIYKYRIKNFFFN